MTAGGGVTVGEDAVADSDDSEDAEETELELELEVVEDRDADLAGMNGVTGARCGELSGE